MGAKGLTVIVTVSALESALSVSVTTREKISVVVLAALGAVKVG